MVCGSSLIIVQAVYRNRRNAWIVFLAIALGVMPSLAVTWFSPFGCGIAALAAFVLALLANLRIKSGQTRRGPVAQEQAAVYWLLRALMLLWWGAGLAISLEVAWWQPNVEQLFSEAGWLRLLGFGAFLVTCLSAAGGVFPALDRRGKRGPAAPAAQAPGYQPDHNRRGGVVDTPWA